jgi:hypothetical protein
VRCARPLAIQATPEPAASISTIPALLSMLFGQGFVAQGLTVETVK